MFKKITDAVGEQKDRKYFKIYADELWFGFRMSKCNERNTIFFNKKTYELFFSLIQYKISL